MIPRTVFFLAMAAFGASSCSARSDGYVSSAYHWNQDDGEFRSAVLVAEDCALGGDSVAVRDLIMLSGLTDGDRSEVVGESLSKIWDKRGPGDFFSGVGFVPWPILDALPGYMEVARNESEAEKMRQAIRYVKERKSDR